MADVEYWIQLENRAWDVTPNDIDRLTGRTIVQIPGGAAPFRGRSSSARWGIE